MMRSPARIDGRWVRWSGLVLILAVGPRLHANQPEWTVWTEVTAAGRTLPSATPAAPVYYQAINVGYQTFAGAKGGDRRPPDEEFLQAVLQQLVRQGYRPSTSSHPPTLLLGFSWGDLNGNRAAALHFIGGDRYNLLGHVDPFRYGTPPPVTSGDRFRALTFAGEDLYVVTIAAYDYQAATRGEVVRLWQTRISCPQRGFYAADALPKILTAAAPFIGRDTRMPVWGDPVRVNRRAEVEIGESTVLEPIDPREAVILDIPQRREAAGRE